MPLNLYSNNYSRQRQAASPNLGTCIATVVSYKNRFLMDKQVRRRLVLSCPIICLAFTFLYWVLNAENATIFSALMVSHVPRLTNTGCSINISDVYSEKISSASNILTFQLMTPTYNSSAFTSKYLQILETLHLPDTAEESYSDIANFSAIHLSFVTAFPSAHYMEALPIIETFSNIWPNETLYVYDLDLSDQQMSKLIGVPFIKYRKFNFSAYPSYVQQLHHYRWKPLIVAEILREYQAVFWYDAGSRFNCQPNINASRPYTLYGNAGHSIYFATHPGMYEYFTGTAKEYGDTEMWDTSVQLVYATATVKKHIIRPWVLCALEENCMAPKGANLWCGSSNNTRFGSAYGNCHRFDQSAVNILLTIMNNYTVTRYTERDNSCIVGTRNKLHSDDVNLGKLTAMITNTSSSVVQTMTSQPLVSGSTSQPSVSSARNHSSSTFSSKHVPILDKLHLTDNYIDINSASLNFSAIKPVFVTGISSNHYMEALALVETVYKIWPTYTLYVYDLGLNDKEIAKLSSVPLITFRKFNFSLYPAYVENLLHYRWKPLIIAEVLLEHQAVWWCDASVRFKCPAEGNSTKPYILYDRTGHSLYAATHPAMFPYFDGDIDMYGKTEMWGANVQLIYATPVVRKYVLQPWVLCALEEHCMAPIGSTLWCQFASGSRFGKSYGNCNRYDQSAVNILLAILHNYTVSAYTDVNECIVIGRSAWHSNDNILLTLATESTKLT